MNITGIKQDNFLMVLNVLHKLPLHVKQKGKIDKITILFKPFGLNHFINMPLCKITEEPVKIFTEWMELSSTPIFLNSFFCEQNNEKRISILENYLLSIYKPFHEYQILNKIINTLNDFTTEISIAEIAKQNLLSSRTLNRLFTKHIGITPIVFKKIARFRHSLKNKIVSTEFEKLTKISYESNFYDQSYFIKVYKHFTGQNPKAFFNSVNKFADGKLIFKLSE